MYIHAYTSQVFFAKGFQFSEILNVGMADKYCGSIMYYSMTEEESTLKSPDSMPLLWKIDSQSMETLRI